MALTVTDTDVAPVVIIEQFTAPANEAIDAGEAVYLVAASGKVALADENVSAPVNEPEGISLTTVANANETVTILRKGIVDLGDAMDAMDFGTIVYLSQTAGKLEASDPANGVVVGEVVPGFGATTADKLLKLDL